MGAICAIYFLIFIIAVLCRKLFKIHVTQPFPVFCAVVSRIAASQRIPNHTCFISDFLLFLLFLPPLPLYICFLSLLRFVALERMARGFLPLFLFFFRLPFLLFFLLLPFLPPALFPSTLPLFAGFLYRKQSSFVSNIKHIWNRFSL